VQLVFVSFLGEDLLFRGLLLPRMRGVFGRGDFVANGVLFAFYHLHQPWSIPASLADIILTAYLTRRWQSVWMSVIAHSAQSVFVFFVILALVLGCALHPRKTRSLCGILPRGVIHPSAQKTNSRKMNFRFTEFSEVTLSACRLRRRPRSPTGRARGSRPRAPLLRCPPPRPVRAPRRPSPAKPRPGGRRRARYRCRRDRGGRWPRGCTVKKRGPNASSHLDTIGEPRPR
jgi:Type II CAAX prenyl endopeptidase Rce1-like